MSTDPQAAVKAFPKRYDFFVGIDSDGCAFDTMEVKHKECFIPNIVQYYGLAAISKYAREAAEFVNLYSKHRGVNRFPALTTTFDLLKERPEIRLRGFEIPDVAGLRAWLERETKLGNATLKAEVERTGDADLKQALAWSEAVNRTVNDVVHNVPPFPYVRESLAALAAKADVMVVSATPTEALEREWAEHDIAKYVGLIAGQEMGNKKELLALGTAGRYAADHVLMIGDAPGDRKAAEANGYLFFPINPGHEDESWKRFHDEAMPRFFGGTYAGAYMAERIAEFEALLPDAPRWK